MKDLQEVPQIPLFNPLELPLKLPGKRGLYREAHIFQMTVLKIPVVGGRALLILVENVAALVKQIPSGSYPQYLGLDEMVVMGQVGEICYCLWTSWMV